MAHEGLGAGGSSPTRPPGCSRSSSSAASCTATARPGTSTKVTALRGEGRRPRRGPAADAAGLPRADARQRAGAHLAALSRGSRSPSRSRLRTRCHARRSPLTRSTQPLRFSTKNAGSSSPWRGEGRPCRREPVRVGIGDLQLATPGDPGTGAVGVEQPVDRPLHEVGAKAWSSTSASSTCSCVRVTDVAGRGQRPPGACGRHERPQLPGDPGGEGGVHGHHPASLDRRASASSTGLATAWVPQLCGSCKESADPAPAPFPSVWRPSQDERRTSHKEERSWIGNSHSRHPQRRPGPGLWPATSSAARSAT